MAKRQQVRLRFLPYMRGEAKWHEIDAYVTGDLAVHKTAQLQDNGELAFLDRWTVSHVPTGDGVMTAAPRRFYDRGAVASTMRALSAWAAAFQIAAPEFFAAAREGDKALMSEHVSEAMRLGRAL